MPTGWLVTRTGYGYVLSATNWDRPPPVASACTGGAAAAGAQVVPWRPSPGGPGLTDYVCMWPDFQHAPFGQTTPSGWYYGLPWRTASESRPRDAYLQLDRDDVEEDLAQAYRPVLRFDTAERWRPLNAESFLAEGGHELCVDDWLGDTCNPLSNWTDLRSGSTENHYLRIRGNGGPPEGYHSPDPACRQSPPLLDCDTGPASAIYWEQAKPPGAYTYIGYWWFLRYNDWHSLGGDDFDHEGDWAGVTIAAPTGDPGTFHFAGFSAHGLTWRYLREALICDDSNMVGSCGTEQSPSGQRVHAFIAEGSHAAYPQPCGGDGCWQTEASGETDLYPEQDFDGERKWGRNNDPAALLRLPPRRRLGQPSGGELGGLAREVGGLRWNPKPWRYPALQEPGGSRRDRVQRAVDKRRENRLRGPRPDVEPAGAQPALHRRRACTARAAHRSRRARSLRGVGRSVRARSALRSPRAPGGACCRRTRARRHVLV